MRIMYWSQLYAPYIGGVEVTAAKLLTGLRARGHEPLVVTSHGHLDLPDVGVQDGVPVHRFFFASALANRDLEQIVRERRRLAALKREFRPHLIHVNISDPSFVFHYQTADAWPAPFLVTLPVFMPEGGGADSLMGRALREAAWVTAPSQAVLDDARRIVPEIISHSSVLHYGLDMPDLQPSPLPFDAPRILAIGRLVPEKGFDLAIGAFARVLRQVPAARLIIAGDGVERPALVRQASELGVAGAVDFLGWVDPAEVPRVINTCTMVLQPSRWQEAFGLVALQGSQMARPVIAARVGGVGEVVVEGETGLLVDKDDTAGLADAILALLANPEQAAAMGAAGRSRAAEEFPIERHVSQFDSLYRRLAEENAHAGTA
ncbi:MAG TPA: glycosyltransferase family 4 protein [Gemmatimonadaceae bacterium]|nr:glycosyltransferase family 4 protein [Gemmatimonadaceae bacterium]